MPCGPLMESWRWENVATLAAISVLVLGLYALGAGAHAGWGFLLMANLNHPRRSEQ